MTDLTNQLTLKFFGTLFIFLGLSFFMMGGHAEAIINNNGQIPTAIRNIYEPASNNCVTHRYGQDVWVSRKFDTTNLNPVVITQGTDSVDLWFNELSTICNNALTSYPIDTSGPIAPLFRDKLATKYGILGFGATYGITTNLAGTSIDITSYNEAYFFNTRYVVMPVASGFSFPMHADFTLSGLASLPVGVKTITIIAQVREIHWRSDGSFRCVSTDTPATSLTDTTCAPINQIYDVLLDVQPPTPTDNPPTLTITDTCTGITAVGDDIDYAGWGDHISVDGFPSGAPNTMITTNKVTNTVTYNPPTVGQPLSYRIWNIKTDGNYDNSKDVIVLHAWNKPPGCAGTFTTTTTSVVTLDDPEAPNIVTFDGTVATDTQVNGLAAHREYYILKAAGGAPQNIVTPPPFFTDQFVDTPGGGAPQGLGPINKTVGALGLAAGDSICQSIKVDPGSGTADASTHNIVNRGAISTTIKCETIVSNPIVTFNGSDVSAGNGVNSSGGCSINYNADIKAFNKGVAPSYTGSGVKLAAFATGKITGFTSGLNSSNAPTNLSFANNSNTLLNNGLPSGDFGGKFGTANCITDYYAKAVSAGVTPVSNAPYTTIGGAGWNSVNQQVLLVNGDLVINGNIFLNNSPVATRSALPYLWVIVNGKIFIQPGVNHIEGIFVAQNTNGYIDTCANGTIEFTDSELYNNCGGGNDFTKQLTIKGAFITKKVKLNRAYGRLVDGTPKSAEIFTFNPMFYMNSPDFLKIPATNPNAGKYDTYTTLPPVL